MAAKKSAVPLVFSVLASSVPSAMLADTTPPRRHLLERPETRKFLPLGTRGLVRGGLLAAVISVLLSENYSRGTLTAEWAIYLAVLWGVLGAVGAALFWCAFSLPLIKRRREKQ
jgi:hypothetical protein